MNSWYASNPATPKPLKTLGLPLVLLVLISCGFWISGCSKPGDPRLTTPLLAVERVAALKPASLYFNAPAQPWLPQKFPNLDPHSDRTREMLQAVQNPQLFRRLDRKYRFDTLLLTGDPSQYRPLLDHLVETKDWGVVYLDHTSLIFQRSPSGWTPHELDALTESFLDPRSKSVFLAMAATKLLGLHLPQAARDLLDRASKLDPKNPETCNATALYHMSRGEWSLAMSQVDKALEADPAYLPALASKAQILYSIKHFSDALTLSTQVLERNPEDPNLLFYHAKIAHEAHAYTVEIKALTTLITLAEAQGHPTSGYRIYLGQAYAATSDAKPAAQELSRALADPELPKEQRDFAQTLLTQIKSRADL